jgi:hypothetical protein
MKRRIRISRRKPGARSKKRIRINRKDKNSRKPDRVRRRKRVVIRKRVAPTDPRVARALGLMRREGVSASKAARDEGLKLKTFRKGAGRFLYRSGPGKPWKARSEDQLRFLMTVITDRGPLEVVVSNSRERKVLSQYNFALRMFRAGEDGADAALKEFEGKRVGGQTLLTDIKLLIEQEEVGNLDFEGFYVPIGAAS